MISTRWQTGNSHLRETATRPADLPRAPRPKRRGVTEHPLALVGIGFAAGVAMGLLLKWGWRR